MTAPSIVAHAELASARSDTPLTATKRPRVSPENEVEQSRSEELARGAEGVVARVSFLGRCAVRKTRFPKRYRHPTLDKRLTYRRVAGEARTLLRLRRAGVRVPAVYDVDASTATIIMEDINGMTVKGWLVAAGGRSADKAVDVMRRVGAAVRQMHDADVVHGDLTTSNVIVEEGGSAVVIIDFGLSTQSGTEEDKAVDLYVLERAIDAAHPEEAIALNASCFDGYKQAGNGNVGAATVLDRLEEVRSRGRKRDMTG